MRVSDELKKTFQSMSEEAVRYGKEFQKNLDYSRRSLADLEEILEYYYHDRLMNHPTPNQVHSMALIFGCYLGECILKNGGRRCGYDWAEDSWQGAPPEPVLAHTTEKNRTLFAPVAKVEKRLILGAGENVLSFYDIALQKIWQG